VLAAPPSSPPAGTDVEGLWATDEHGKPLRTQFSDAEYRLDAPAGAVRYRYRLDFRNPVALSSTGAGLDSERLYAVARSVFVAPAPAVFRDGTPYPLIRVHFVAPPGWRVVTSWGVDEPVFAPAGNADLLGATLAAAPDFRVVRDTAGGVPFVLAIRGARHFADEALASVIAASLRPWRG